MWQTDKVEVARRIGLLFDKGWTPSRLAAELGVDSKSVHNYRYQKYPMTKPGVQEKFEALVVREGIRAAEAVPIAVPLDTDAMADNVAVLTQLQEKLRKNDIEMAKALAIQVSTWRIWRTGKRIPSRSRHTLAIKRLSRKVGLVYTSDSTELETDTIAVEDVEVEIPSKSVKRGLDLSSVFREKQLQNSVHLALTMAVGEHELSQKEFQKTLITFLELITGYLTLEELLRVLQTKK